ncbi:branched-chain amino acid ABC transporter permease [Ferrimicrobium acidiphilum]|jgi:branched-subunit amino acid ABC-type transport system permease component|uniref:High-affinity branched-chain amino acid transport system permease protein LivH n=1 Tax=Ferrimicrobium acidiphilum DSM 19497 TaxID=1121877 RepID=A0A0D8FT85_9ACTN|nr:branched-chain amino acid ABC transporter permease [Ferrimicrobium acidiphilum]KJE76490.1 high-affinity branched-chain amino acid transport system permease protein LivH [Ferrimicrobium acidiphilum DSM 19497]MCL5052372.1 branched-chain amino acid ABC transporter permease [Gammaproteobacteria bacterium]
MLDTLLSAIAFGIVLASVIAIASMGFTIQFGLTNMLNLSYGGVMTAAGFVAYLAVSHGINAWYTLLIGGIVGAVITLVLGIYVFRPYARRGAKLFEMMMVTLGLALVVDYGLQALSHNNIYQFTVLQSAPIHLGPVVITPTELILAVVGLVVFLGLEALLRFTRIGKALRATAAEASLARSCGIRTGRVVIVTWLLSGFLCGLAGVVYIVNSQSIGYSTGELFLPLVVAAALLGGAGSPRGAVVAALVMGIVTQVVAAFGQPAYSTVAGFAVLVIVLLARPGVIAHGASEGELTL